MVSKSYRGADLGFCFWLFRPFLGAAADCRQDAFCAIPKKFSKKFRLARPRLYIAGAFSYDAHAAARGGTPGRPRQDFNLDFLTRSMRRNSPQTARAATKEVPRC